MNNKRQPVIFGEVLYDNFPDGQQVLGGAPFNVAWHLQAFGDQPRFVSRVGEDAPGKKIIKSMRQWGMDTSSVQIDKRHPTGAVDVTMIDNEPHYHITPDCAYDFIDESEISITTAKNIFYHGTLALRNTDTRQAYEKLVCEQSLSVFLDVNLRQPWWQKEAVSNWLKRARWVKLNLQELYLLGSNTINMNEVMAQFQAQYDLELLIVTRGAEGAIVRTSEGEFQEVKPPVVENFIDTVGAGDAFTAVFLHGLISDWPLLKTLESAQQFACAVVGLRGAVSNEAEFYRAFQY